MGVTTNIEWTDATLNLWWGCQKVSPGCKHCYADTLSHRWGWDLWGPKAPRRLVVSFAATLKAIRKSHASGVPGVNPGRTLVFVGDMSDTFEDYAGPIIHPDGRQLYVDDEAGEWFTQSALSSRHRDGRPATLDDLRAELFSAMESAPELTFQLLTKRPENIMSMVPKGWRTHWPHHVWMGVSVENQAMADARVRLLWDVPARVRYLSCEPLIEAVDLAYAAFDGSESFGRIPAEWVIVGGESGHGARPMDVRWVQEIKVDCARSGAAFFMKQGSAANWPAYKCFGAFHEDIRIREFPHR